MKIETEIIEDELKENKGTALDQDPGQVACFLDEMNGSVYVRPAGQEDWMKVVKKQIIKKLQSSRSLVSIIRADYMNPNGKAFKVSFPQTN